ncbi:SAVED domain-containing protein [Mycolicibacterium austroafricanum]|uniref:SAVED domain-containing protein n=1 Tax=Mycolicibacterium austroafricanum TaxID=39687 RepID=UPI0005623715|nr:SAVED domain-containing protein [Mycolicibacterium austroafricanum]QZY49354.1 SAVED domain-containing protein [Mycolicibacterium austroafricanum]
MKAEPATPDPTGPIFISYRHSDGIDLAAELAGLLRAAGIPVWRDKDDLPPGDTEHRLTQAISAGISGAVIVTTADIANSTVVKFLEAPLLLQIHDDYPEFALAVANAIENEHGSLDYTAPDKLLGVKPGTLAGVDQHRVDRAELLHIVDRLLRQRVANHRAHVADTHLFELSVQTRNAPQSFDRTLGQLDIRLRPAGHGRLPSAAGLSDLRDTIGLLPDAVTQSAAERVRIRGGAHLCVAFALGASLPSSRIGHMEVFDQQGSAWSSAGEARFTSPPHIYVERQAINSGVAAPGRRAVGVYLDLLAQRSDAAFDQYLEANDQDLTAWQHMRSSGGDLLDPSLAGATAADAAAHIRALANDHANADVHLLLRCPFPIAMLMGRLTNTLRVVAYEWDDSDDGIDADGRPCYVPALRVRASAATGVIEEVLLRDTRDDRS